MDRYLDNLSIMTETQMDSMKKIVITVIGCGSIGGHIIELLGRFGFGEIRVVDNSMFSYSNLSNHILSKVDLIKSSTVKAAYYRMKEVNPDIKFIPYNDSINESNILKYIKGSTIVISTLNSIDKNELIIKSCKNQNIPLYIVETSGWIGSIFSIKPSNEMDFKNVNTQKNHINPTMMPSLISSLVVSECLKDSLGISNTNSNHVITFDLLNMKLDIKSLNS
jgi:molybdopterin/thiamine biosynthesis adenylyltransferase